MPKDDPVQRYKLVTAATILTIGAVPAASDSHTSCAWRKSRGKGGNRRSVQLGRCHYQ